MARWPRTSIRSPRGQEGGVRHRRSVSAFPYNGPVPCDVLVHRMLQGVVTMIGCSGRPRYAGGRSRFAVAICLGLASCSCFVARGDRSLPNANSLIQPLLGKPFGTLIVLEVQVVGPEPGKSVVDSTLNVFSVDGVPIEGALSIAWVYGGATARVRRQASLNGRTLEPGALVRVQGYEAGEFCGSPDGLASPADGPLQLPHFQFMSCFHVTRVL
jgi:hypothetical protein